MPEGLSKFIGELDKRMQCAPARCEGACRGGLHPPARQRYSICSFQGTVISITGALKGSWCQSDRNTPVPIPNTTVKTVSSDNTWRETAWEDSPVPGVMKPTR